MMVGASATDTLAITNALVPLGTAINTTGSINIHAGTNPLRYSVEYTYWSRAGGMMFPMSIKPAFTANLPANASIVYRLEGSFTPPCLGPGEVEIVVRDTVTGRVLTQTFRRYDVQ